MELFSLKELCKEVGVSRRTIQGYEKVGVIQPVSRNKYGYLLYNHEMLERAKQAKFLRSIGFSNVEVSELLNDSNDKFVLALKEKIGNLERRLEEMQNLLYQVKTMVEELSKGE